MRSAKAPEARETFDDVRGHLARGERAMRGCDCLDWRVHGHVCAWLAPPGQGLSNAWRDIPGLRDPAPRPEPSPGDWLPGWLLARNRADPSDATAA